MKIICKFKRVKNIRRIKNSFLLWRKVILHKTIGNIYLVISKYFTFYHVVKSIYLSAYDEFTFEA